MPSASSYVKSRRSLRETSTFWPPRAASVILCMLWGS